MKPVATHMGASRALLIGGAAASVIFLEQQEKAAQKRMQEAAALTEAQALVYTALRQMGHPHDDCLKAAQGIDKEITGDELRAAAGRRLGETRQQRRARERREAKEVPGGK